MKLYYNHGATIDCYTLVDETNDAIYGLSENPLSPQGFNQYCGTISENSGVEESGNRVHSIKELPQEVQKAILMRLLA